MHPTVRSRAAAPPRAARASALVLLVACLFAWAASQPPSARAGGRTWYVRADADPDGTGDREAPFRTIAEGLEAARPGDLVDVGPGTYRGELDPVRAGEPGARIRLVGHDAVIRGDGDGRLFEIERDYLTVRGFEITHADVLVRLQGASHVRIVGNRIHDAGSECIRIAYLSTDNLVARNRIHGCGKTDFDLPGGRKNGEGVYIGTAPEQLDENPTSVADRSDRNHVVANRIVSPAECVDVKEDAQRTLIVANVCRRVRDPDSGGISTRGIGTRIRGNLVEGGAGAGIRLGGDASDDGIRSTVTSNVLRDNEGYAVKIMRTPQRRICGNVLVRNAQGDTNDDRFHPASACRDAAHAGTRPPGPGRP
ncbi:MAG TPA: DUF1565 domain-containing protein [Actinomycetota bacterium]|nr:DUF1565 domain-containing protein [Actinomycetota bacterium]